MKKQMKILSVFMILAFVLVGVLGCGRKELDAEKVVDAYLRAELKGDFEDYAELLGKDEAEVEEEYNAVIDDVMSMFDEVELLGTDFSDDFKPLVIELLASCKYEVGDSEKDDDGNYTVDVTVYPSDVYTLFFDKTMEEVMNTEGDVSAALTQALEDAIAEQTYGEGVNYQIHINYDENKKQYSFDENDTDEIMEGFFVIEDNLEQIFTPSGTVYDNPYLNWTKTEWEAASDDEKNQCCLAVVQFSQGFTDEQMAMIDTSDSDIQQALQAMKDGIDLCYKGGTNISIGDYANFLKEQMSGQE